MATTAYGTSGANPARRNNAIYWAVAIALIALIAFAVSRNRTVDTSVAPNSPARTDTTTGSGAGAGAVNNNAVGTTPSDATRDTGLETGSDRTTGDDNTGTDNLNQDNRGIGSPGTTTDTPTGNH